MGKIHHLHDTKFFNLGLEFIFYHLLKSEKSTEKIIFMLQWVQSCVTSMVVDKNNIIFEMEKLIFIQALRKILVQVLPLININLDKEFSVKSEHPLDISPFSFTYA